MDTEFFVKCNIMDPGWTLDLGHWTLASVWTVDPSTPEPHDEEEVKLEKLEQNSVMNGIRLLFSQLITNPYSTSSASLTLLIAVEPITK